MEKWGDRAGCWARLLCTVMGMALLVAGCRPAPGKPPLPGTVGQQSLTARVTPQPPPAAAVVQPPAARPLPGPAAILPQPEPHPGRHPTLEDFWAGGAHFVVEVGNTGLPMGESETLVMGNGELFSYVHASDRSAGTRDQCGNPVAFPGCTVIYRSRDGGHTFAHDNPPVCQFACRQCPCTSQADHIEQQQYPRMVVAGDTLMTAYEYQGRVMLRRSADGLNWSAPEHVGDTLLWHLWYADCPADTRIGDHPFVTFNYECMAGGPPGLWVEDGLLYVFVGLGQNPGSMGCYVGPVDAPGDRFRRCTANPLFVGAAGYGSELRRDYAANPAFDFRTISSAEVVRIGHGDAASEDVRYYMLYEGVRGPGPGDPGDTQFGLGLARSLTNRIDGPWEKFPANPILVDLPGNIGLGHADLVVLDGRTILYTSLDGVTRSRLALVWSSPSAQPSGPQ